MPGSAVWDAAREIQVSPVASGVQIRSSMAGRRAVLKSLRGIKGVWFLLIVLYMPLGNHPKTAGKASPVDPLTGMHHSRCSPSLTHTPRHSVSAP